MTKIITTNINLEDEIRTIKALEAKLEELKELKEEKEAEIKKLLDNAGLEELQVGAFTIRFTNVVRNNFNTSALELSACSVHKRLGVFHRPILRKITSKKH